VSDPDVPADPLRVAITSSTNSDLIDAGDVNISGTETVRYLTITPAADSVGDATFQLFVTDLVNNSVTSMSVTTSVEPHVSTVGLPPRISLPIPDSRSPTPLVPLPLPLAQNRV
jgi:hypothetical protein